MLTVGNSTNLSGMMGSFLFRKDYIMKNDSLLFPFSMPGDSIFDYDFDGKLSGFETACRDAVILATLEELLNNDKSDDES